MIQSLRFRIAALGLALMLLVGAGVALSPSGQARAAPVSQTTELVEQFHTSETVCIGGYKWIIYYYTPPSNGGRHGHIERSRSNTYLSCGYAYTVNSTVAQGSPPTAAQLHTAVVNYWCGSYVSPNQGGVQIAYHPYTGSVHWYKWRPMTAAEYWTYCW